MDQVPLADLPTPAQQLLVQLLDPPSRLAWFQTCVTGRDQVLQHVPQLTVNITAHPVEQLASDIEYVSSIRGAQHTGLRMVDQHYKAAFADIYRLTGFSSGLALQQRAVAALNGLSSITHHITALDCGPTTAVSAPLLWSAARALPQLQHLALQSLHPLSATLPALPLLTHLTIGDYRESDLALVKQYIHQLHSLTLHEREQPWRSVSSVDWQQLTSAPLPLLTSLQLPDTTLSQRTSSWLQAHTPALRQLTVRQLCSWRPRLADGAQAEHPGSWGLEQLTVTTWDTPLRLVDLVYLPVAVPGPLTVVTHGNISTACQNTDEHEALLKRLADCRLLNPRSEPLWVRLSLDHEQRQQKDYMPQAVAALLAIQPPITGLLVETYDTPLDTSDMQKLAQINQLSIEWSLTGQVHVEDAKEISTLPQLPGLVGVNHRFENDPIIYEWCGGEGRAPDHAAKLDDQALSVVLHCAPNLKKLSVGDVNISADYQHRRWQVGSLEVAAATNHPSSDCESDVRHLFPEGVSVKHLVRMPHPEGGKIALQLEVMICDVLDDKDIGSMGKYRIQSSKQLTLLPPPEEADVPEQGRALTNTLEALSCQYDKEAPRTVVLYGWHVTRSVLEALEHLHHGHSLEFREGVWLASTEQCKLVLPRLPQSYKSVTVEVPGFKECHREALTAGGTAGRCQVSVVLRGDGWSEWAESESE